jgi:hypothetical protein
MVVTTCLILSARPLFPSELHFEATGLFLVPLAQFLDVFLAQPSNQRMI